MQTWVHEKGWSLSSTRDSLQQWVLVGGDLSVNVLEVLGAAGAEGPLLECLVEEVQFPQCAVFYTMVKELRTSKACTLWL